MNGTVCIPLENSGPEDALRAAPFDAEVCAADWGAYFCTAVKAHSGPHVAYGPDGEVCARFWEDPS